MYSDQFIRNAFHYASVLVGREITIDTNDLNEWLRGAYNIELTSLSGEEDHSLLFSLIMHASCQWQSRAIEFMEVMGHDNKFFDSIAALKEVWALGGGGPFWLEEKYLGIVVFLATMRCKYTVDFICHLCDNSTDKVCWYATDVLKVLEQ